jgi:hypothetical protein
MPLTVTGASVICSAAVAVSEISARAEATALTIVLGVKRRMSPDG